MSMLAMRRYPIAYARSSGAQPALSRMTELSHRQKPLALIVDRDADFQYILTQMLSSIGYEVIATDNLADARSIAMRRVPTLIVTDLRTGLHDRGIVPGELRRIPRLEWVPMIVCSAWPYPNDRAIAQSLGADLFMTVPVDFGAIRELATQLISGAA